MPDRRGACCAGAALVAVALGAAEAAGAAELSGYGLDSRSILLTANLIGALAFGLAMAALYLRERQRGGALQAATQAQLAWLRAELDQAEALIDREGEIALVWSGGADTPLIKGDPAFIKALTRSQGSLLAFGRWLESASAMALERAVDALRARGEAFDLVLEVPGEARIEARGRVAAGRAVLRLRSLEGERLVQARLDERLVSLDRELSGAAALLAALPVPLWRRGSDGRLSWVNAAYAAAVEAASPEDAVARGIELLDKAERRRLVQAAATGEPFRARLPAVVAGRRRVLDILELPNRPERLGLALDVTEAEEAKAELARHLAAHARTLDQLATAVAVFGADRRLRFHNAAYRNLFGLDPAWLATGPEDGAILDALRVQRKLPEQADYRAWRRGLLHAYRVLEPFE